MVRDRSLQHQLDMIRDSLLVRRNIPIDERQASFDLGKPSLDMQSLGSSGDFRLKDMAQDFDNRGAKVDAVQHQPSFGQPNSPQNIQTLSPRIESGSRTFQHGNNNFKDNPVFQKKDNVSSNDNFSSNGHDRSMHIRKRPRETRKQRRIRRAREQNILPSANDTAPDSIYEFRNTTSSSRNSRSTNGPNLSDKNIWLNEDLEDLDHLFDNDSKKRDISKNGSEYGSDERDYLFDSHGSSRIVRQRRDLAYIFVASRMYACLGDCNYCATTWEAIEMHMAHRCTDYCMAQPSMSKMEDSRKKAMEFLNNRDCIVYTQGKEADRVNFNIRFIKDYDFFQSYATNVALYNVSEELLVKVLKRFYARYLGKYFMNLWKSFCWRSGHENYESSALSYLENGCGWSSNWSDYNVGSWEDFTRKHGLMVGAY